MPKPKRPRLAIKKKVAVKKLKIKHIYIWGVLGGGLLLLLIGMAIIVRATEGTVRAQLQGNKVVPVDKPVVIHLDRDLRVANAQIRITPADAVDYRFEKSEFGQTKVLVTPKKALKNNQEYKLEVKNLQHILSRRQVPAQVFSFRTELALGIASFTPVGGQVTREVNFSLVATDQQAAKRKYQLYLEPAAELEAKFDGKTTWQWKPKAPLSQGVVYKVRLEADKKMLQNTELTTVSEPKITAATAKSYFYPNEKITITFDKPMRTDQTAMLDFPLPGKGAWESDSKYTFTPEKLERNKSYTYTFKAGFASKDGGVVETNKAYTIKTPGPATVISSSPHGSNLKRSGAQIRFGFDQPVNRASAESHFQISPKVTGNFRWENNTLVYTTGPLDWQTTYTASITPGVEAIHGVPGTTTASVRFSTELQTIKLNVPAYRQTYKLSCEASALRMALAKYGVMSDDMTITQRMGYTPRALSNGEWDDPYSQFVGDINGKQWNKTGYGAYAPPVAAAARSFGRNATAHFGVSAGFIAEQIHAGRPVVVWGYQYTPSRFSWRTPSGQTIQAWQGEHTRTVVGVVGKPSAPQGFYVTDPSYGSTTYWSASSLMGNMNVHGGLSNQAVVVY